MQLFAGLSVYASGFVWSNYRTEVRYRDISFYPEYNLNLYMKVRLATVLNSVII